MKRVWFITGTGRGLGTGIARSGLTALTILLTSLNLGAQGATTVNPVGIGSSDLAQNRKPVKSVRFKNGSMVMAGTLFLPEGFDETRKLPDIPGLRG